MAVLGPRGPGCAHRKYEPYDIQEMQHWKEKTKQAEMVLEANMDVMTSLRRFYVRLTTNKDFPPALRRDDEDDIASFAANLDEIMDGIKMHAARARFLVGVISDRSELVSFEQP
jgi:hypothetical protein